MVQQIDPDFYSAYFDSTVSALSFAYGRWGQTRSSNSLSLTIPSSSRYICNLGTPRKRLLGMVIKTTACHVQIASHAGSGYSVYARGLVG